MKLEGKCEHCGHKLKLETEKEVASHILKIMNRMLDKMGVKVLCGDCDKMTEFNREGDE